MVDPLTFEQFVAICDVPMMGLLLRYVNELEADSEEESEIRRAALAVLHRVSYRRLAQFAGDDVDAGFKIVVDANQRAEWEDGREHLLNLVQTLWVDDDDIEILPPPWRDR